MPLTNHPCHNPFRTRCSLPVWAAELRLPELHGERSVDAGASLTRPSGGSFLAWKWAYAARVWGVWGVQKRPRNTGDLNEVNLADWWGILDVLVVRCVPTTKRLFETTRVCARNKNGHRPYQSNQITSSIAHCERTHSTGIRYPT